MKLWLHWRSCLILVVALAAPLPASSSRPLQVSADGRYLEQADGRPFFWLGDTAWELFHRLDREEARHYLERRAAQGFTVIQAVVLAESDGLRTPNPYGHVPFHDLDPRRPNEGYFEHVDFIVDEAARRGLHVALLPTWGDKVPGSRPGVGPVVFDAGNARVYGRFLGERYREAPVIWMLGGDRPVDSEQVADIWRALAAGLEEGDDGAGLMTFHPSGEATSARWFHDEPWLDFNVYQSGHARRFHPVERYAGELRDRRPRKPFLDAEPPYEDIPVRFWEFIRWDQPEPLPPGVVSEEGLILRPEHFAAGFFDDYDVRVHAYWNLLSGACGHTYGHNTVWQMFTPGLRPAIPCLQGWREALERPGAQQMRHVRFLFEARSFASLRPAPQLVPGDNPAGAGFVAAALSEDGHYAIVYLAQSRPVEVDLGPLAGAPVRATWFDPRTGEVRPGGDHAEKVTAFVPPSQGADVDWVLVLDAATAKLPPLGPAGD